MSNSSRKNDGQHTEYSETHVEVDTHRQPYASLIDIAEREYRERFRPQYNSTVDPPSWPDYQAESVKTKEYTVDGRPCRPTYRKDVKVTKETVEPVRLNLAHQKSNMGYYDEDGHYHSFRHGIHKLADKIAHPHSHHEHSKSEVHESVMSPRPRPGDSAESYLPNTVTIPCHHIRLGDFLMLQGRPCQLHEESSFISNPVPSVVVQTMLGPVFKQYRILDMSDGQIVAMTETGDVKQSLPVIDQSNFWSRLNGAFESGRGSVRVLVLNDGGHELAVDMKVIHGSRL